MEKKRIDGRRLAQNIGQQIIILGTIENKSSNGKNIGMRTTDGVQLNVALPEPMDGNADGYIEVHGTVQSKSTVSCSSFINFPPSMAEDFDSEQYNETLSILNVVEPELSRIMEEEMERQLTVKDDNGERGIKDHEDPMHPAWSV